jgi:Nucleotidyl transferase AbiEii toxin, Type IV TA system
MHAVFGLKQLGLTFELKGGTSLSKGFGIIQRFSEHIDIRIEPFDGLQVDTNPNHERPAHIESRRIFYEKLRYKIRIPGIMSVERDTTYDDQTLMNADLRLAYETHFGSIAGLKDEVPLEVGFDQTSSNQSVTISSWVVQQRWDRPIVRNRAGQRFKSARRLHPHFAVIPFVDFRQDGRSTSR